MSKEWIWNRNNFYYSCLATNYKSHKIQRSGNELFFDIRILFTCRNNGYNLSLKFQVKWWNRARDAIFQLNGLRNSYPLLNEFSRGFYGYTALKWSSMSVGGGVDLQSSSHHFAGPVLYFTEWECENIVFLLGFCFNHHSWQWNRKPSPPPHEGNLVLPFFLDPLITNVVDIYAIFPWQKTSPPAPKKLCPLPKIRL